MYLLTETASPFALERWAAFFANFGQFAKGFFYTLYPRYFNWCLDCSSSSWAHLWGYEFNSQQGSPWHLTCLCRNLPEHTLTCAIRGCLLWDFNID